jgi:hypothetical protein
MTWEVPSQPSPSPGAVTAAFLRRVLSGTPQTSLPSVREKVLGKLKKALPMHCVPSLLCRVRHSAKSLPSVFKAGTRQRRRFR